MKLYLALSETKYKGEYYAPATCNRVLALLNTMGKLAHSMLDIANVADRVVLLPENNARTRYCDRHTARHSVASHLISSGVDISSVQKLLNHKDISSTLRYAKLSEGKALLISSMVGG
jgi:site-specific recombinase XerD